MKHILYFIKWNFTGMRSFTKRYFAYFGLGIVLALLFGGDYFFVAPVLMFVDLTQDILRDRYADFKKEQQDILNSLKEK